MVLSSVAVYCPVYFSVHSVLLSVLCFFLRCNTALCICCDRLSSTFPFGYGRASVDCETPEEQASYKIKVRVEVAGCCKIKELSCLNKVN